MNLFMRGVSGSPSVYWHDSGVRAEFDEALGNGAVGLTLNPFLVASSLEKDREMWREKAAPVVAAYEGDRKAEELTKAVVGYYAARLRDIYLAHRPGEGYVCAQTNPSKCGDAGYMIGQAKRYSAVAENICVKLPATRAGLEACEECAAMGMNVVMTVSMTVPQVLSVGEAVRRGHDRARANGVAPGFSAAVIMGGRLDDYLRDVAEDNGLGIPEDEIICAGAACYKRAIALFAERGYDTMLMAAAFRGSRQLKEVAGSRTILSVAPQIANMVRDEEFSEDVSARPIDTRTIADLSRMRDFVRAYEPDGMKPEEFITFGAVNRTMQQFIESGWNRLKEYRC